MAPDESFSPFPSYIDMEPLDDQTLMEAIVRTRDSQAFSRLYDRHAPMVFGLACRMLGQRQEAEDLLQEVFFALWEKAARYDPARAPVGAWLLVMARSRCLDRLRRRRLRLEQTIFTEKEEADMILDLPEPGVPILEGLATEEQRRAVKRSLDSLPAPQRTVLEAAFFDGLTQQEIADKLGEPLGTVKTRMRLGMMKLAQGLAEAL